MTAFNKGGRFIRIFGTKGELTAYSSDTELTVYTFADREKNRYIKRRFFMDLLKRVAEKKVLLVAHRGVCGGNIPCNFLQVFQAALLAGGHNDDISITEDPEQGWGWLADRGFDLIQTDFVFQCRQFLEDTGRRNK